MRGAKSIFSSIKSEIKQDLWQYLKQSSKPIVLYGTGDGADKIIDVLSAKGIEISGVFASDNFKQGKVFRGFEVTNYKSFCDKYGSFIVLLSFATNLDTVIDNINKIKSEQELYAPDVPVFGEGLFDMNYFTDNLPRLEKIYNLLSDEKSKQTFLCSVKYRLSGDIKYLKECQSTIEEQLENLISSRAKEGIADIGAYNGDTAQLFSEYFGSDTSITAIEPDARNYKKLLARCQENNLYSVMAYNLAAWNKKEELSFVARSGRNCSASENRQKLNSTTIQADALDNILTHKVGFIKIDAEGSEAQVIEGMEQTISKYKPIIKIAAYHKTNDYIDIPEKILKINPDYKLYMRHLKYIPCWDTDFIFV